MNISFSGGLLNFFLSYAVFSVADVLGNCCGKKIWLLTDDTDITSQPFDVQFTNVIAIDGNCATKRVVESLQELNNGTLATTAGTNKSHRLALHHLDAESVGNL